MDLGRIRAVGTQPVIQSYDKRDTILYALGLGFGEDPLSLQELPFVFEGPGFRTMPTMVNIICHPGFWAKEPEYGIDWVKLLHAEQDFTIHNTMPTEGRLKGNYSVVSVEDKGPDRGALLHQLKTLFNDETGEKIATVRSTLFLRGNGGQGGFGEPIAAADRLPDRSPDKIVDIRTRPHQALIYRLSGDWNPLHADPKVAEKAGFSRPILHGMCTNGLAARAIVQTYCDFDPAVLRQMFVRFSRPVLPGETLRFEFFEEGVGSLKFRAVVLETGDTVLDRCTATLVA